MMLSPAMLAPITWLPHASPLFAPLRAWPAMTWALVLPAPPVDVALWWYLAAMSAAVVIIGISKAGFGGGVGIVAVPLIANVLPAQRALGVMLPILIVADVFANLPHLGQRSWRHLWWMISGALLGIAAGSWVLFSLEQAHALTTALDLVVGGVCLGLVGLQGYRLAGGRVPHVPTGPWSGRTTGVGVGLASTLAHSAGPIAALYLLEQRLAKRRFVGTMVLLFFMVNLAKLPTYFGLGLIDRGTLIESAWFAPLAPIGALLGLWMHKRIAEKPFTAVIYVATALAAGRMIYEGLA